MARRADVRFEATGRGGSRRGTRHAGRLVAHGANVMARALPGPTDVHAELTEAKYGGLENWTVYAGAFAGTARNWPLTSTLDTTATARTSAPGGRCRPRGPAAARQPRGRSAAGKKLRLESPLDLRLDQAGRRVAVSSPGLRPGQADQPGPVSPGDGLDVSADLSGMNPAQLHSVLPQLTLAQVDARLRIRGTPQAPESATGGPALTKSASGRGLGTIPDWGREPKCGWNEEPLVADVLRQFPELREPGGADVLPMQAEGRLPDRYPATPP
jgi:hypothetical protein